MAGKKKSAKKKAAKAAPKVLTEAELEAQRKAKRSPQLRLAFVLAELLINPERGYYGAEAERERERRRTLFVTAAMRPDAFQYNAEHVSLEHLNRDLVDVLGGDRDAEQISRQLIDHVFDLRRQTLATLMPTTIKAIKAEADAKRKAEEEARRRKFAEQEKARREKYSAKKPAKKGGKSPATSTSKAAKKPAAKKTPRSKPIVDAKGGKHPTAYGQPRTPGGHAAVADAKAAKKAAKKPSAKAPTSTANAVADAGKAIEAAGAALGGKAPIPAARCTVTDDDGMRCAKAAGHVLSDDPEHKNVVGEWA